MDQVARQQRLRDRYKRDDGGPISFDVLQGCRCADEETKSPLNMIGVCRFSARGIRWGFVFLSSEDVENLSTLSQYRS